MDRGTLIRTIILAVALINQFLVNKGYDTIPFGSEEMTEFLSIIFTVVASAVSWFKNNYITKKGQEQKEVLQAFDLTNSK